MSTVVRDLMIEPDSAELAPSFSRPSGDLNRSDATTPLTAAAQGDVAPEETTADAGGPDTSMMEDRFPPWMRMSSTSVWAVLALGLTFNFFCRIPLWPTDVWGHVNYGRFIAQTGALPAAEPLMPLAQGVRWINTCWLGQLVTFLAWDRLGFAGLQGLGAVSALVAVALLSVQAARTARCTLAGWIAAAAFLWLSWTHWHVVRPQLMGAAFLCWLLTRVAERGGRRSDWWAVPLAFVVWVNLHASFVMGLAILCAYVVGRVIDVLWRTGSIRAVLRDGRWRRWMLISELAAAATLVTPHRFELYAELVRFSGNLNLHQLTEWQALSPTSKEGYAFAGVVAALAMALRWSPRRVRTWEAMLLLGGGWLAWSSGRFQLWWAVPASYLLAVHAGAIWSRFAHRSNGAVATPAERTGKWTIVAVGIAWICFGFSPLGVRLLHRRDADPARSLAPNTPVRAVLYLREHPPQGQMFNIYEWGDYLLWAGPPNVKVFVNSHAHLVPRDVWRHYLSIADAAGGWDNLLDRYGVNALLLDFEFRGELIKRLRADANWRVAYEDGLAAVIVRKRPVGAATSSDASAPPPRDEQPANDPPPELIEATSAIPREPAESTRQGAES